MNPPQPIPERSAALHTVLTFVTCGLWSIVWFFQLGSDIQQAKGGDTPNVLMDFLLTIVTCGIWGIVVAIQWPEHINDARRARGMDPVQDLVMISIILCLFTGIFHYTYWQVQLNRISQGRD